MPCLSSRSSVSTLRFCAALFFVSFLRSCRRHSFLELSLRLYTWIHISPSHCLQPLFSLRLPCCQSLSASTYPYLRCLLSDCLSPYLSSWLRFSLSMPPFLSHSLPLSLPLSLPMSLPPAALASFTPESIGHRLSVDPSLRTGARSPVPPFQMDSLGTITLICRQPAKTAIFNRSNVLSFDRVTAVKGHVDGSTGRSIGVGHLRCEKGPFKVRVNQTETHKM